MAEGPSRKKLGEEARVSFGLQSLPEAAFRLRRPQYSASEPTLLLLGKGFLDKRALGIQLIIRHVSTRRP
ncbi:hypothetical protein HDV63DRAFT_402831 [Trichoderma sp. SZMC 28014]